MVYGGNKMKVIAINSSARKDGNTAILINEVFKELHNKKIETELITLAGDIIHPCKACFLCNKYSNCIYKNDSFYQIFEKIKEADGIILGSPVYSANISSTMQAFLERAAVIADLHPGLLKYKVGIGVIASRRGGAINALDALNHFFLNHEMFIVGSTYWNIGYGKLPGDVINDIEALENMKNLGQNMSYLINTIKENQNENK